MEIRLGIAGLSHFHIHMFLEEALQVKGTRVIGVYDEDPEVCEAASQRYKAPSYKSPDELITDVQTDVVVTAAINSKKADIIIKALEIGKPVIVDKPLVTSLSDIDRIEEFVKLKRNPKLYMMLTERYNPVIYTVKKCIEAGEIGEIVNCILLRPHKLKPQTRPDWFFKNELYGGLINDLGVHDLDLIRWLTGSEVEEIIGASKSTRRYTQIQDFEDNSEVMVRMKDGSTAFVRVDWLTPDAYPYHGDCRMIIVGTKGQIEAYTVGMHGSGNTGAKAILCTNNKAPFELPLESRDISMSEDIFRSIIDDNWQAAVTNKDVLLSTRLALMAQLLSNNMQ